MKSKDKKYRYKDSELQVIELEDFTDIDFGNDYYCTLKKIGDSIVYSNNRGNMKYVDVSLYYQKIEAFIEHTKIERPIIEIQDYKDLTGKPNANQKDIQVKYLANHKDDYIAAIICNVPDWLRLILRIIPKIINPSRIKILVCKDFSEAIQKAHELLKQYKPVEKRIGFKNVIFKPEWGFEEKGFKFINGVIPKKLFYTSFEGNANPDSITKVVPCLNNIFEQGNLDNSSYIRVADYSMFSVVPLQIRNKYVKTLLQLNKKHKCRAEKTYICGASSFIRIAMQLYSSLMRQEFIFVDDVETAFKVINGEKISPLKLEKKKSIKVDKNDIDEIIALSSSLIWGETTKTNLSISEENPLRELASTLSLIQDDLIGLQKKEVENTSELKKSLDRSEKLANELKVKNKETIQLNEELITSNEQLHAQKEKLEMAQNQLLEMNTNLEALVQKRTTKLKRTVKKLNKSVAELDRFVYSASHDLSAPLKSVLGLLNIAKIDPNKNRISQCLVYIENSIYKLEDVIKSLISYSRNSRLKVKKEPFFLGKLVNEIIGELAFLPMAKSIEFIVEISDSLQIITDRQRLGIVLRNLINNSIKYIDTEKSNSKVVVAFDDDEKNYIIKLSDNGIGIDKHQLKKIFNMFYRGTEKSQGSGLGLFISKETVATIEGKIKVNSIFGKGTDFSLILPKKTIQKILN